MFESSTPYPLFPAFIGVAPGNAGFDSSRHTPRCARASKSDAFSLIELLAVVSLIGILIGLTVGGGNLIRGRALDNAGNQVGLLFELARQQAMARNVLTAVVLMTGANRAEDGRALTIMEYSADDAEWKQTHAWEILPENLCVDIGQNPSLNTFVSQSEPSPKLPYTTTSPVRFRNNSLSSTAYAYRVFLPSGAIWSTSTTPTRLQLVEGHVEGGRTHYLKAADNYYRITLITATGRIKVERPGI